MMVLDQVHKLSSLVRPFIIMSHVYRPLPALVGQHKVGADPHHPQEFPAVSTARTGPLSRARHRAAPSCSSVTTVRGEGKGSKHRTAPWS